jgi:GH24 family phage-related lysozyme (muramidase)
MSLVIAGYVIEKSRNDKNEKKLISEQNAALLAQQDSLTKTIERLNLIFASLKVIGKTADDEVKEQLQYIQDTYKVDAPPPAKEEKGKASKSKDKGKQTHDPAAEQVANYSQSEIQKTEQVVEKVEPVVQKTEPIVEKVEPVVEKTEPVMQKTEPIVQNTEPIVQKAEPAVRVAEQRVQNASYPAASSGSSMSEKDITREYILRHKQKNVTTVIDKKGVHRIGYGFNLEKINSREKITALGLQYDEVFSGKKSLNDEQINSLFESDLAVHRTNLEINCPGFGSIDFARRTALLDLSWLISTKEITGNKTLVAAINAGDWNTAATEVKGFNSPMLGKPHLADIAAVLVTGKLEK